MATKKIYKRKRSFKRKRMYKRKFKKYNLPPKTNKHDHINENYNEFEGINKVIPF